MAGAFFKISPSVFYRRNKCKFRLWHESTWWRNFHFWINSSFKHKVTAELTLTKHNVNEWKAVHLKENMACSKSFQWDGMWEPLKEARGVQRSSSKPGLWTFSPSHSLEARERERLEKRGCEQPLLWEQSGMSNNAFLSLWPKAHPPLVSPSPIHPPTTTKRKLKSLSASTSPTCPQCRLFLHTHLQTQRY